MRFNSLFRWQALLPIAVLALTTTGCGGLAAAGAISPLQFFLPALIQNQPALPPNAPRVADSAQPTAIQVAQAR